MKAVPGVGNSLFNRCLKVEAEALRRRNSLPWNRDAFVGSTQGQLAMFTDRGPERPWALAGWVEAPTLLVYGRKDKRVDPKAAHRATKESSFAHVIVIADSGHAAMMEHQDLVDRWWREWLGG